jgi:histidinol phosphatase-like PHP family hydrolase
MSFLFNQDLHIHTVLSKCCEDNNMTIAAIYEYAISRNYVEVCVTDHVWSSSLFCSSDWHRSQDIKHISQSKPLPSTPNMKFFFGCEAEFMGGDRLSISRPEFDLFDFITLSVNHMHMHDIIRPQGIDTADSMSKLILNRLSELLNLDLPWGKIGIAHLSHPVMFSEGSVADVLDAMDYNTLKYVFTELAERGAGIELNASAFEDWDSRRDSLLRFYSVIADTGCSFYLASDAHFVENLGGIQKNLPVVVEALGLSANQQYYISG